MLAVLSGRCPWKTCRGAGWNAEGASRNGDLGGWRGGRGMSCAAMKCLQAMSAPAYREAARQGLLLGRGGLSIQCWGTGLGRGRGFEAVQVAVSPHAPDHPGDTRPTRHRTAPGAADRMLHACPPRRERGPLQRWTQRSAARGGASPRLPPFQTRSCGWSLQPLASLSV